MPNREKECIDTTRAQCIRFIASHNALYLKKDEEAQIIWKTIEQTADALDLYYMPIRFETSEADLVSKDALTRTQLREVIRHCRQFQKKIRSVRKDDYSTSSVQIHGRRISAQALVSG